MDRSPEQIAFAQQCGLLHDVGKLLTPLSIPGTARRPSRGPERGVPMLVSGVVRRGKRACVTEMQVAAAEGWETPFTGWRLQQAAGLVARADVAVAVETLAGLRYRSFACVAGI